ncbi:hypothetical protein QBC34DRAFT_379035 [Podospora aff. communis PSN243]|uniref:GPI anchored serine-rich protein n=1 Tax=Podospora aff. communis PSN243 TaxID=3040156 RepID=A0AAV9GT05_9PEZI|nr:hypothetical protein QBC34DRAFT_379035 [Podospora aff. communis PSN243]
MRVSVLSAAALAFGLASASLPAVPVVSDVDLPYETSICEDDISSAVPTPAPSSDKPIQWTTSTILSTSTFTVTKCEPTVTKCPAESIVVTTAVVTVGTTICPVSDVPVPTWTIKKPVGTAPPVDHPVPTKPPVWSSGALPPKPEPTKAVPVTAGVGRAAVPAMAAVALVAALL